ncbi:ABC transporter ATP-binding protein [Agrobacterium tumefaciens]|nr:ABC transporter ATP-binding protein [Agrobacterium tumefaciens]NSY99650.1 ABC transporter ATP-binding protein [Agrobacterium tumefaciens]NSZ36403.1 ABC transporter ATP-binding protein [Agrobacterium tumefaciens]NTB21919.1 ABC transporter ATP-binding protein [Agrobacterium tumefaciens]NTB31735.1 ABC transporter ATP-binding protein [Agrobacterium tumefaciens]NTB32216.1 ABC transporter ATP-binding protein [Agrobacterium tumefaciens]
MSESGFLTLSGIRKTYGTFVAVDSIDLDVKKGEFISLLGPSGCGKTTTLQMIAGFVDPTQGSIALDGRDMVSIPVNRRGIGIVFQNYALFPHMTVAENVAFGLKMQKTPKAEVEQRVKATLDVVHLGKFAHRYPRELSGGQQQRVALARAVVLEPKLLLLDEPFSNLDAKLKEEMQIDLLQLQRQLQITTILVTHDQGEALALSDRVAVMEAGTIAQIDTPFEIYERPATRFVGQFLGRTNVLSIPQDQLPHGVTGEKAADGRVTVTVRPEKVFFVDGAQPGAVAGRVRARIFQGTSWLYQIDTDYGDMMICRPNDGGSQYAEGTPVKMSWLNEQPRSYANG